MTTQTFQSDYQIASEMIQLGSTKEIKDRVKYAIDKSNGVVDIDGPGHIFLELVSAISNNFTKDIAERAIKNEWTLSEKQAWCVAYQIMENRDKYAQSVHEEIKKAA